MVEIETAKSLVELPSPYAGVVAELLVDEGETVAVGTPIIAVVDRAPVPAATSRLPRRRGRSARASAAVARRSADPSGGRSGGAGPDRRPRAGRAHPVLVGYGPRTTEAKRRARKTGAVPRGRRRRGGQAGVQSAFSTAR